VLLLLLLLELRLLQRPQLLLQERHCSAWRLVLRTQMLLLLLLLWRWWHWLLQLRRRRLHRPVQRRHKHWLGHLLHYLLHLLHLILLLQVRLLQLLRHCLLLLQQRLRLHWPQPLAVLPVHGAVCVSDCI
jgi:hypothetical protein